MYESLSLTLKFWVSKNFQEIVRRAFKAAMWLMLFLCCFWVPEMEPPGGTSLTARRGLAVQPSFWVLMNGLAVMNTHQATRTNFGSILVFWGS